MSTPAYCLFALGLGLSLAAACGDDEATIIDSGGTGGVPSGGAAGSGGQAGTPAGGTGGSSAGTAGVGGDGSGGDGAGAAGAPAAGGTSGAAGTAGTGGDGPDAGPEEPVDLDAGAFACPADFAEATAGATTNTVNQEVIITRVVFDGNDIRVTFRGAGLTGFNFAEPLALCTGPEESDCDGGVATLEGSGNDAGPDNLIPGEEISYTFTGAFDDSPSTPEAGELALVNGVDPNQLLFPDHGFVRAYINWGDYVSPDPVGPFDASSVIDDLEARADQESVWTLNESIEVGSNDTIFATGDVTSADGFETCSAN